MITIDIALKSSKRGPAATRRSNRKADNRSTFFNKLLVFIYGMLVGVISTIVVVHLCDTKVTVKKTSKVQLKKLSAFKKPIAKKKVSRTTASKTTQNKNQIEYDFYNLLPKSETAEITRIITSKSKYFVQTGIFRTMKEADEMKAQLALNGFEATILNTKSSDNIAGHKVVVGPCDLESAAINIKKKLQHLSFANAVVITD